MTEVLIFGRIEHLHLPLSVLGRKALVHIALGVSGRRGFPSAMGRGSMSSRLLGISHQETFTDVCPTAPRVTSHLHKLG